jgi:hypothetical protein
MLQSELDGNVFDNPPAGHSVKVIVFKENKPREKRGWNGNPKISYFNRVTWDLSGNVCSSRDYNGLIQINPEKILELDAQYSRNMSTQTWVNIFAHEGVWGNAADKFDCLFGCEDGEISAGALGVTAYLYAPYFVFPSSRETIRSKFGF